MAATEYTYSLASDFPNAKVDSSTFLAKIQASAIITAYDYVGVVGDVVSVWMKDVLSSGDQTLLDGVVAAHTGESPVVEKLTEDGKQIVSVYPAQGASRTTLVTHDFTDKTTWYCTSVQYVDEVASHESPPGDYTLYSTANSPLVDSYHGKIFKEDFLTDDADNAYNIVVKVNDVAQAEEDPHFASPNRDYVVDYDAGTITFHTALTAPDVVKVTYHHVQDSVFTVKPKAGKTLTIAKSEVQFSTDLAMLDTVVFQPYGLVEVFAPSYTPVPYPAGTLIPLGDPLHYKTIRDFIGESNGALPSLPALGGASWRGTSQGVVVMPWDYAAVTELQSSAGMEIRISLEHDTVFTGESGSATFYCLSEDEV